jgi:hypothetical protein
LRFDNFLKLLLAHADKEVRHVASQVLALVVGGY